MYIVIAHYRARSTSAEAVAALLPKLAVESRREPGNLSYAITRNLEDPDVFVVIEKYEAEEDFLAHRRSTHFQEIGLASIIPHLDDRTVETFIATSN